jgi:FKBP-type peptidyl-prolyl cis-trans isomerase FkpA
MNDTAADHARRLLRLPAAALLLAACATAPLRTAESVQFAPSLGIRLEAMERLPSGVHYRDVRSGEGEPVRTGERVRVHFGGWLSDGTQFGGVAPPAAPLEFELGAGAVIRGWDEGVAGMRPGGQRLLVVPPAMAYGRAGGQTVPGNTVLVFLIELAPR